MISLPHAFQSFKKQPIFLNKDKFSPILGLAGEVARWLPPMSPGSASFEEE